MSLIIKDGMYKGCRVVETKVINKLIYSKFPVYKSIKIVV